MEDQKKLSVKEMRETEECLLDPHYITVDDEKYPETSNFGETEVCPYAGWILDNGKMIDLSYGQGQRVRDHREITNCMPDRIKREDVFEVAQNQMGMIRMSMSRKKNGEFELSIDLHTKPELYRSQFRTLKKCVKDWGVTDIYFDIFHQGKDDTSQLNVVHELPDISYLGSATQIDMIYDFYDKLRNGWTPEEIKESVEQDYY